ncbi:MAG: hypothetical protein HY669_00670 [Chloroflexi bacterium]|nr:hypothetical protein [Chloroflexota bacterium]
MTQLHLVRQEQQLVWALPQELEVPPDRLRIKLDIYDETILLHRYSEQQDESVTTRVVSAQEIARAFARDLHFYSGILPAGALWWSSGPEGQQVALWRGPRVWRVALVLEAFKPPRRFRMPLPGLVFICLPGRAPRVFAATSRPVRLEALLYHAPLFNLFDNGSSCAGTHKYPDDPDEVTESFFASFFTREGGKGRSRRHPNDLLALWQELDGKNRYPLRDLVPVGTVAKILGLEEKHS